jgi:UDP-N-acetylglucosamine acyltransferase
MKPHIGPDVRLGSDVKVHPFAYIDGNTTIGDRCEIFPHVAIGTPPHDVSYKGSPTRIEIGEECIIREGVSIHRASEKEEGLTRVGSRCFFMAHSHVGHDCRVGDDVILTNCAALGGHSVVEDKVLISAMSAVHQFARVGTLAMVAGGSMVVQDVPPYCMAHGDRARLVGLNEVGLDRRGVPGESIKALRQAYRTLFRSSLLKRDAIVKARTDWGDIPEVERMLAFIESSERGVCRHGRR